MSFPAFSLSLATEMTKDQIIDMLMAQLDALTRQLEESNRQNSVLTSQVAALTAEVAALRAALEGKEAEAERQEAVNRGLSALVGKGSEKQAPPPLTDEEREVLEKARAAARKSRGNNGARRDMHAGMEEDVVDVYPEDPAFNRFSAREVGMREAVRYVYERARVRKIVYRIHVYSQDGTIYEGATPPSAFLNSSYDATVVAELLRLRYGLALPVERIAGMFREQGFSLGKQTAHGLIAKASALLERLRGAIRQAILSSDYVRADETYHRVLLASSGGLGSRKGYVWSVAGRRLIYVIYDEGSRRQEVITREMDTFRGTLQSDAYRAYRTLQGDGFPDITRIACLQHVKRKFRDAMDSDPAAGRIYALLNRLYHNEHMHRVGRDGWTVEDNLRWRQKYAPPILLEIQAELETQKVRADLTPKSPMAAAVGYLEDEWEAVCGIFSRGDTDLDNNLVERMQRYFAMSRHSSLFFGSHRGAERAAVIYTVALSAKMNGLDLYEYFLDIINTTAKWPPNTPLEKYRDLLPDRWKPRKSL